MELDMDSWQALHFPSAVLAAVVSVKKGVKRAHLVDARVDGAALPLSPYSDLSRLTYLHLSIETTFYCIFNQTCPSLQSDKSSTTCWF